MLFTEKQTASCRKWRSWYVIIRPATVSKAVGGPGLDRISRMLSDGLE